MSTRMALCPYLFGFSRLSFARNVLGSPDQSVPRKPATLKLELQRYASELFDAEAKQYLKCSESETELRSWLDALVTCVADEVFKETYSASHDIDCPATERRTAIFDGLKDRVDYWIIAARTDYDATMAWGRGAIRRATQADTLNIISTHTRARIEAEAQSQVQIEDIKNELRLADARANSVKVFEPKRAVDRNALKESYFSTFPEKVMVLDMCWAARQHYREWMRWFRGELKDGSKADRAFRAVLLSGKRPEQYRTDASRPKSWK